MPRLVQLRARGNDAEDLQNLGPLASVPISVGNSVKTFSPQAKLCKPQH